MGNLIDSIATAIGVGVLGYFAYVVLLPQMKQILQDMPPLPSLLPPMQQQVAPAPLPPVSSPPVQDLIDDAMDDDPLTRADTTPPNRNSTKRPSTLPSSNTPASTKSPAATATPRPVGKGLTPEALGMKSTGKKVTMVFGKDTAGNGMRYNCNHSFHNYVMIGLFKIASGQELIEMKTDGPNHSGCSSLPRCFWAEPRFEMSGGKATLSFEGPHGSGDKGHTVSCPSCKSIPGSYGGKYIGYAVAAYGPKGGRIVEQWVDPSGTGNSWQLTMREKIDSRFGGAGNANRDLPVDGRGLEAEVRMHGGSESATDMKNAFVFEIAAPGTAAFVQSLFSFLEAKTPRRYNHMEAKTPRRYNNRWAY